MLECEALVDFYNATDGDNWTNNTNWLQNSDVSTRFGVLLLNTGSTNHVRALHLHRSDTTSEDRQ